MPIRQERVIALVNAAIDYRAELQRVQKWISNRALDTMTHIELLAEVQTMNTIVNEAVNTLAAQYSNAIFMEFTHFYQRQRINARNKASMALKRRAAGVPERAQPLHHFDETDKLQIRHDLLDQPKPLHIRPERPTRTVQTAEEALELEQQIAELNTTNTEKEEADKADAPFRSPDGTPKPLTFLIQDESEDEQ